MLHREYVPFIPIRCSKPEGPLDPPTFPVDKYHVPDGFWEDSAHECFKAAREIMDLVTSCQEWNVLVETPIVGFAIYNVAFNGVYCINFPWMDADGYMCTTRRPDDPKSGESKGFETARKALEMIGQMRPKLHMADGWFKTTNHMHKYFRRMKSDYRKNVAAMESGALESDGSPLSTRNLSLREGGTGGGLDEFKLLERTLKEFGNLEDQDVDMEDAGQVQNSQPLAAVYDDSNSGSTVKSEEAGDRARAPSEPGRSEGGPWNAINAVPGASRHGSMSTPTSGRFRSYDSYPAPSQQQPPQQSRPPHPQQPSTYAHQINSFRPAYSHEASAPPHAPPSLTSPGSHTATTPSQHSPPFDRQQHPPYTVWTPQNAAYPMQPPQQPYSNNNGIPHPQQQPTPNQTSPAYPSPAHQPQQQQMQAQQSQPWNTTEKEAWLNSIDTRLGGDDLSAFVDGGEVADYATMAASRGYGGGWLGQVWGGATGHAG